MTVNSFLVPLVLLPLLTLIQSPKVKGDFFIHSEVLGTTTRVHFELIGVPVDTPNIMYLTDGDKLLQHGFLDTLQTIYDQGKTASTYFVFVSSIDLNTNTDQRNEYFFCNPEYVTFFEQEVIPRTESKITGHFSANQRALLGISFGGLNAAWFSARSIAFKKLALLSPITYPCDQITSAIAHTAHTDLDIYLSTGINDAENYVSPLQAIYQSKNYRVKQVHTTGAHDFSNWINQLESVMDHFFPKFTP